MAFIFSQPYYPCSPRTAEAVPSNLHKIQTGTLLAISFLLADNIWGILADDILKTWQH